MKFINKMFLVCPEKYGTVNVRLSHENKANNSKSIIDHILVTESLFQYVVKYHSMHDVNNLSDHNAIQIEMCVPCDGINNDCSLESGDTKVIWDRDNTNHISNLVFWMNICNVLKYLIVLYTVKTGTVRNTVLFYKIP